MIKLKIVCYLLCFASLSLIGQTDEEREIIIQSYNMDKINELKAEFKAEFLQREVRIKKYLQLNKTAKRKFKKNGKSYQVYDIVNGQPVFLTTSNVNSAISTKTNELHTGGSLSLNLDGQNMVIGVWDAESALGTHNEFKDDQAVPQSRITYPEFGGGPFIGTVDDHATHVAGTLIARGAEPNAKGMAPKAALRSYDWSDDATEALTEATSGLLLSNHSYTRGSSSGINRGAYTSTASQWDQIGYQAAYYLMVCAAGNYGTDRFSDAIAAGYDQLPGGIQTCKNNITVANADPFVIEGNLIQFPIHSSSSRGPSDDFRVKPDIAGDGTGVYSSVSVIPSGSSKLYDTSIGTSMASPNVTGSLLLLQQYYNQLNSSYMFAATLKALVCHTALDDISKVGPDPIYGWGLLNTEASALAIQNAKNGFAAIKEVTISNGNTYTYQFAATAGSKLQATICWTDPAGPVQSNSLNSLTPRLVNDLDLRLQDPNTTVFTPWKLDKTNAAAAAIKGDNDVDNIERIDITSPITGNYTLTVTHKGTLTSGSQPFSLIITGANLTLGITDKALTNVTVWPNPVSEKLNISFKANGNNSKIRMYDIHGRQVYKINLDTMGSSTNHEINTNAFYNGIYILNIQDGNAVYNKKIIIE